VVPCQQCALKSVQKPGWPNKRLGKECLLQLDVINLSPENHRRTRSRYRKIPKIHRPSCKVSEAKRILRDSSQSQSDPSSFEARATASNGQKILSGGSGRWTSPPVGNCLMEHPPISSCRIIRNSGNTRIRPCTAACRTAYRPGGVIDAIPAVGSGGVHGQDRLSTTLHACFEPVVPKPPDHLCAALSFVLARIPRVFWNI